MDSTQWIQEKSRHFAQKNHKKLPYWFEKIQFSNSHPDAAKEFFNKLRHIEEVFVIEPKIWAQHYSIEDIVGPYGHALDLEGLYEIIIQPAHRSDDPTYSLFLSIIKRSFCVPIDNIEQLLDSEEEGTWATLIASPPSIDSTQSDNLAWFMRQSRGLEVSLELFFRSRSFAKAMASIIAVFSFMENIYHFVHRLQLAFLAFPPQTTANATAK